MRRTATAALGMAVAAALMTGGAPAQAAESATSSCTVAVSLPATLVITSWNSLIKAELSDPSDCVSSASWTIASGTADTTSSASFSSVDSVDQVSFYTGPSGSHPGSYRAVASSAYSDDTYLGDDGYQETVDVLQQDSGVMVAKYGSRIAWKSAVRSGRTVELRAVARRFSPSASFGGYVAWRGAEVLVQKKAGAGWTTVKTVRASAKGLITARVRGAAASWRLSTVDSSSVWGASTSSKRR